MTKGRDGWVVTVVAVVAIAVQLTACDTLSPYQGGPTFLTALNDCLKKHGIAHPENRPGPSEQELTVPVLIGARGMHVPFGVERAQYKGALEKCGAGYLPVAPAPITSPLLRHEILELAACLGKNGYVLPPPNFPGPGPALDTRGVDVASARWVATVKGCGVTKQLTQAALEHCLGAHALEGVAKANAELQQPLPHLPRCLKEMSA